ncbi:cytochrome b5-related protein-like [Bacillus rossius redtenbacheri]|uniref:cytochrome b5-related protein-like n=1 Tax=Bacillus rossius redtenbacheri TaxID=93214 RepID=UPI002FDCC0FB
MVYKKGSPSSLPGLWKYPSFRNESLISGQLWLQGKREDDGAEGLWRVHDDLYDLSGWLDQHPGGAMWLQLTKGTDITEAFESHHVSELPEKMLGGFRVRSARTRRNSPYSFREDGFYRTLKRRVRRELAGMRPSWPHPSKLLIDLQLAATLGAAALAAARDSYLLGALAGLFLAFLVVMAHNFVHLRDNFRMYYFDLCLMSSRDWRITHALSHHLYPNTLLDLEVTLMEPLLEWLPYETKSTTQRYISWLYSPLLYSYLFHGQLVLRLTLFFHGYLDVLRKSDAIALILPAVMYFLGGAGFLQTLLMWSWIILTASFFFGVIGINGAHHHPDVFMDGDAPREDTDWGLAQLDTLKDRTDVSRNLFLALTQFGHHYLHHLFPTLDHCVLGELYPAVERTLAEFGEKYDTTTVWDMLRGQFVQLARTSPNVRPAGYKSSAKAA